MTICLALPKTSTKKTKLEQDTSIEPTLEELLADPIIQLVMKRDGICRDDVEQVMQQARIRLMTAKIDSRAAAA